MSHPEEAAVELKKGDYVKKLVLLSVAALMLASTVLAPVAMAKAPGEQAPGEVDIQSVTLEPNGPWTFSGTIQCTEGRQYVLGYGVLLGVKPNFAAPPQAKGPNKHFWKKLEGLSMRGEVGDCETTGPQSFTLPLSALPQDLLTGKEQIWAFAGGAVCDPAPGFPSRNCAVGHPITERVKLR
jgi:hypothetical protein